MDDLEGRERGLDRSIGFDELRSSLTCKSLGQHRAPTVSASNPTAARSNRAGRAGTEQVRHPLPAGERRPGRGPRLPERPGHVQAAQRTGGQGPSPGPSRLPRPGRGRATGGAEYGWTAPATPSPPSPSSTCASATKARTSPCGSPSRSGRSSRCCDRSSLTGECGSLPLPWGPDPHVVGHHGRPRDLDRASGPAKTWRLPFAGSSPPPFPPDRTRSADTTHQMFQWVLGL